MTKTDYDVGDDGDYDNGGDDGDDDDGDDGDDDGPTRYQWSNIKSINYHRVCNARCNKFPSFGCCGSGSF